MHTHTLSNWQQEHDFGIKNAHGEKRTQLVLILTAVVMVIEIIAGSYYGSMALLADGWHMATHVAAFMIALFTYRYARKHAKNPAFSFGTGKVSVLGGFASAVTLAVVAVMMLVESVARMFDPQAIHFNEAIVVAVLGLVVNLLSALLLKDDHHHHHHHGESHHHTHDHNLKAAYMHVLADALTSVLAIVALVAGKYFGWVFLDPLMGIVGAYIILRWAYLLVQETSPILLDSSIEAEYKAAIVATIEDHADNLVTDVHIWKVGPNHYAAIVSLVTEHPRSPTYYKELLSGFEKLSHITVEVNQCDGKACFAAG